VQARPIRPGDHVDLLDLEINPNEDAAAQYRDDLREALGDMTVELTYIQTFTVRGSTSILSRSTGFTGTGKKS
jgi:hypothetical protein